MTLTFEGAADGVVDGATRNEIRRWLDAGWFVTRPQIAENAANAIFSFSSREETGLELESKLIHERGREGEEIPVYVPGAYSFLDKHPREGLRVGFLAYSQRSGWLGRLVRKVYAVNPQFLEESLGDYRDAYNVLGARTARARMALALDMDDRWRDFAIHPTVQTIQLHLAIERLLHPVLDAAERNRIRTVKGLALLADVAYRVDVDTARTVAESCGVRDLRVPVVEHLRPGLIVLERLLPPGAGRLMSRFSRILPDERLDTVVEYWWSMKLTLTEKYPTPPDAI